MVVVSDDALTASDKYKKRIEVRKRSGGMSRGGVVDGSLIIISRTKVVGAFTLNRHVEARRPLVPRGVTFTQWCRAASTTLPTYVIAPLFPSRVGSAFPPRSGSSKSTGSSEA